jgi:hypothetical protein
MGLTTKTRNSKQGEENDIWEDRKDPDRAEDTTESDDNG